MLVARERWAQDPFLAVVALVVVPIAAGLVMAAVGAFRARRGEPLVRLDTFFYGWLFAAAFAFTRWWLVA